MLEEEKDSLKLGPGTGIVVVTGGCGYVGSRLVPQLVNQGWSVRVIDMQFFGNSLPAQKNLQIVRGDIRDKDLVAEVLSGADSVVHLAGMANDPSAELNPALTRAINLDASLWLVETARRKGIRRFVNASTATVYGVREAEAGIDENADHAPITLYGQYKSEIDKFVASASDPLFATVNLRAGTVCGWSPRMRLDLTVNSFSAQAMFTKKVKIRGGQQKRPIVVIDDLIRAYILLLRSEEKIVAGKSYNVAGENMTVITIAKNVVSRVNNNAEIIIDTNTDHRSYHISSKTITSTLGFRFQNNVVDGIDQIVSAIESGRLRDWDQSIYRNVQHLRRLAVC